MLFTLQGLPEPQMLSLQTLPIHVAMNTFYTYLSNHLIDKPFHQTKALFELLELSFRLQDINVDTDLELLKKAELYHTQYSLKHEEGKIPYILEEKYIMVPTVYGDDEQDVSLLQEHKIGSKSYSLSKGTPAKKIKIKGLAYNQ